MVHSDQRSFILEISKLAEATGEVLSEARILVYFEDLANFPMEVVKRAIRRARRECRFFPKLPELIEFCAVEMLRLGIGGGNGTKRLMIEENVTIDPETTNARIANLIKETKQKLGIQDS